MPRLMQKSSLVVSFALSLSLVAALPAGSSQAAGEPATFPSAEAAVSAFVDAVRADDPVEAIVAVLGEDGGEVADSGDPVADAGRREQFISAFEAQHKIEDEGGGRSTLVIGSDEYPFPIPLVQNEGKWRWDTQAGLEEILTRRIGENELFTIEVMQAFVEAQEEYAARDWDGAGLQYARRLMSREGKQDGLYWPAAAGEEQSPIGPLVAEAQREGYRRSDGEPSSYHGYIYRMLYGQGRHAPGGAGDYILNNRMIGGFALIAYPAVYDNSGIMTFIVNQDGDVYEQDLGPDTDTIAQEITLFNPDPAWRKVEP